jgi:paraquat-inducible protein B
MSAKVNNIRIGIFVLIALFLFIAGLLAFGARSYFAVKSTYETAIVGEVTGLSIGSGVLFRGVPIGKV